jgi:hypothetical protein
MVRLGRFARWSFFHQKLDGLVSDAVLGIVQVETSSFYNEVRASPGVFREKLAQMNLADSLEVALDCRPLRAAGRGNVFEIMTPFLGGRDSQ